LDVATNIVRNYTGVTATSVVPYIISAIDASTGSRRRLLQVSSGIDVYILPNITTVIPSATSTSVGQLVASIITSNQFTSPNAGASVPSNQSPSVGQVGSTPDDSSSNNHLALGLGIGLGVGGGLLLIAIIAFCITRKKKNGGASVANGEYNQRIPAGSASQ